MRKSHYDFSNKLLSLRSGDFTEKCILEDDFKKESQLGCYEKKEHPSESQGEQEGCLSCVISQISASGILRTDGTCPIRQSGESSLLVTEEKQRKKRKKVMLLLRLEMV